MEALLYIVDDEQHILNLLKDVLALGNYACRFFSDSENLIEVMEETPPDMVICDINMPGIGGLETLKLVREHETLSLTPFLFLTGQNTTEDILEALSLGANDYMVKPIYPKSLLKTVARHLNTRRKIVESTRLNWEQEQQNLSRKLSLTFHDLMGVMGNVYTLACYLKEPLNAEENLVDYENMIGHIKGQSETAIDMLRRVMAQNKKPTQGETSEYVRLSKVLEGVIQGTAFQIEKKSIHFSTPTSEYLIKGDLYLWSSIFYNLMANAVKFTPEKGHITLSVSPANGNQLVIRVEDTGSGISKEKQTQLFKQRVSSNPDQTGRKGNGIGLFLCGDIIKNLQADLILENSSPEGSTFKITCCGYAA